MYGNGFLQLPSYGEHRIKGCHGVLEYHGNLPASYPAHFLIPFFGNILALIKDFTACHRTHCMGKQLQDGQGGDALAAAGLPYNTQGIALVYGKAHIVHSSHGPPLGPELCL